jgi:hypothetical protein
MSVAIFQTPEDFTHSKTMTKGDGSTKAAVIRFDLDVYICFSHVRS